MEKIFGHIISPIEGFGLTIIPIWGLHQCSFWLFDLEGRRISTSKKRLRFKAGTSDVVQQLCPPEGAVEVAAVRSDGVFTLFIWKCINTILSV